MAAERVDRIDRFAVDGDYLIHRKLGVRHDIGHVQTAVAAIDDRQFEDAAGERQGFRRLPGHGQTLRQPR
jgi:hypothetical protein